MMQIANRVLILRIEGRDIEIPVRIFAPEKGDSGDWSCRYEIEWPDNKSVKDIWGFDSIQALMLALQMIGAEIHSSSFHETGKLFFDAPGKGYGFPVSPSLRDLLVGDDKKYL